MKYKGCLRSETQELMESLWEMEEESNRKKSSHSAAKIYNLLNSKLMSRAIVTSSMI